MKAIPQPRLYTSWILLCTLQVCVGLGIEGTIACGIWTEDYGVITNDNYLYVSRVIFFIGLHEMMLHWSRTFVRPVVDDTVMGGILRKERWFERAMMGVSFGLLWWWRLKKEVDGLLVVMEVKREAIMLGLSITDIINWWLYYLTVLVGNVRIVKGVIWIGKVMLLRRQERSHCSCTCRDNDIDDKV
ncbi:hypothetical protein GIB67_001275 [Kingdonia uniflora]|uniref:Transmembrane protein n=1 Tax=Kingdonia uniflora TaxID=39325 RepID=A0A7J7LKZ0_9MAGN|nr:hypothetical protein GIB67_001275 [Kingdonia uniflora]